ncbi:MAG: hypothetical protein AAB965_00945 [Patescibacteria group bacterium]
MIVATPANAGPKTPDAKFYRFATWDIYEHKAGVFNEVTRDTAISYFSGMGDGCGFEEFPKEPFASLENALQFVKAKHTELVRKQLVDLGINLDVED